jgi:hypothetical protein
MNTPEVKATRRAHIGHAHTIPDGRFVALVRDAQQNTVGAGYGITAINAYAMATLAALRWEESLPEQTYVPEVGNCATWKGGVW